jgi:ABC-type uncharacterized transport system fused permease/ATPase subunit
LNIFQNSYQYINFILPFIVLAPRIFSGELEIGSVSQSQAAFERIGFALGLVIYQFDKLSLIAAGVKRLSTLNQLLEIHNQPPKMPRITYQENSSLAIHNLTLEIPKTEKTLVKNLSLDVAPNQSLLIMGTSGVGKSSLLRAIAGLWKTGTGVIQSPKRDTMLFLPQKPYMVLGSLRQQLWYPNYPLDREDQPLINLLEKVNLSHLVVRYDSLDQVEDWSTILSLGEQQRLAFARLLLTQPQYAILDEATSALDSKNEAILYQQLQKTPVTFVSVGHRSSLIQYHQQVLALLEDHHWTLSSTDTKSN